MVVPVCLKTKNKNFPVCAHCPGLGRNARLKMVRTILRKVCQFLTGMPFSLSMTSLIETLIEAFKSVSMRNPGRTRQEVIQLKSPILLKLGINVGFGE